MQVASLALLASLWASAAFAACYPRVAVVEQLVRQYHEKQSATGTTTDTDGRLALIEVWSSPTGTFTILITRPNGVTCVAATGGDWHQEPVGDPV